MTIRKELMILRALHGFTGEIGEGVEDPPPVRDDALCWACDGQQYVFPGLPGKPMLLDTSRIVECPICHGSGMRPPQLRLPGF